MAGSLFDETLEGFIRCEGKVSADAVATRFGRDVHDARKHLGALEQTGLLTSRAEKFIGGRCKDWRLAGDNI